MWVPDNVPQSTNPGQDHASQCLWVVFFFFLTEGPLACIAWFEDTGRKKDKFLQCKNHGRTIVMEVTGANIDDKANELQTN